MKLLNPIAKHFTKIAVKNLAKWLNDLSVIPQWSREKQNFKLKTLSVLLKSSILRCNKIIHFEITIWRWVNIKVFLHKGFARLNKEARVLNMIHIDEGEDLNDLFARVGLVSASPT